MEQIPLDSRDFGPYLLSIHIILSQTMNENERTKWRGQSQGTFARVRRDYSFASGFRHSPAQKRSTFTARLVQRHFVLANVKLIAMGILQTATAKINDVCEMNRKNTTADLRNGRRPVTSFRPGITSRGLIFSGPRINSFYHQKFIDQGIIQKPSCRLYNIAFSFAPSPSPIGSR